jgi:hypothetical protein
MVISFEVPTSTISTSSTAVQEGRQIGLPGHHSWMGDAARNGKVTTGQGRGDESIEIRGNRKIEKLPHTDLCSRHAPTLIFHKERTG